MKNQILREFGPSTLFVDLTAEGASLQVSLNGVQEVLNRLRDYKITHQILLGNDDLTEVAPRLPLNSFTTEPKSYGHLTL